MIQEYVVLSALQEETLSQIVNEYIKNGWQPYGNMLCAAVLHQYIMYQPMVKRDPDENYY